MQSTCYTTVSIEPIQTINFSQKFKLAIQNSRNVEESTIIIDVGKLNMISISLCK